MAEKQPYRFIISGGGTGGHIYPAIAVADEIKSRYPDAQILFVGAKGRMEMKKVPEAGYQIIGLWISGFQRSVTIENIYFPFKLLHSYLSALKLVKKFKPDVVLGFGGYASGPIMLAAARKKVPSIVQEQNSHAGMTNKGLAKKASRVCVAYEGMEKYFPKSKIRLTGNPVRKDIVYSSQKRHEGLKHFGLKENLKTVLVIGGSLGARTINLSVLKGLKDLVAAGYQVVWQTGRFYYDEILSKVGAMNITGVRVFEFIKEMDLAYGAADAVIARAGALSVSELALAGKPVVFVPSPNVAEDHQTKNARAFVEKDAAIMVKDSEAMQKLIPTILELLENTDRMYKLGINIKRLGMPNAAKDIVDEVIELVK